MLNPSLIKPVNIVPWQSRQRLQPPATGLPFGLALGLVLGAPYRAVSGTSGGTVRRSGTAETRNVALQEELLKHGITFEELDAPPHDPLLYPALRCCKAFVSPANQHALDVANRDPKRAVSVARDVARLVSDARETAARWQKDQNSSHFDALVPPLTLVIDCVRSTQNVAQLLRSCAVAGVQVVFSGITPAPPMPSVVAAAGGSALCASVPQRFAASGREAVRALQREGVEVWALETTNEAKELHSLLADRQDIGGQPLALVVGHESYGVSAGALEACDQQVRIKTAGIKNSLNVAVAGSIAIFEIAQQRA